MAGVVLGKIASADEFFMPGTRVVLKLKLLMAAVAECPVLAVLAAAEIYRPGRLGFVRGGRKAGTLVGTVAKRLTFTLTAGAPVVGFPGFDFDGARAFLGYCGLVHGKTLGGHRLDSSVLGFGKWALGDLPWAAQARIADTTLPWTSVSR